MFADSVITRRIAAYESATKTTLREVPIPRVREIVTYLEGKVDGGGKLHRPPVTPELSAFIRNELAMCKSSFLYWARRYAFIEFRVGHGGIHLFTPLESQMVLLEKMAIDEAEMWMRKDKGDTAFLGLCYIIHKARQLGFTTLCQLILLYLNTFWSDYRALSASVDDQKTQDMHAKWALAYERLPYWMRQTITEREKDRGKKLANGSYCALQDFSQEGGLGQGMTWSAAHLTELAAVDDVYCREQVQNHFLPSLADTLRVVAFMESTAQGAGNWWHQIWEQVDGGRFGRWHPAFVPAYAEPSRWARPYVPEGWEPSVETKAYEQRIIATSPKYMNGKTIHPRREHLLWWEEERQMAIDTGTLNLFLANYCVTPEESFQYSNGGAFGPHVITSLDNRVDVQARPYELVTSAMQMAAVRDRLNNDPGAPPILTVGGFGDLVPVHTTRRDETDPRGLVLLFERPRVDVTYSLGGDPAVGIVGWDRRFRSDTAEELNKDNACLSGWYVDPKDNLTKQAFEFAAPVSAREFAKYCYALGKVFSGALGPERGSPLIIETNNGGTEVLNVLVNDHRYYSLWQRTNFNGVEVKQTEQWGWVTTLRSKQELWIYGKDMIEQLTFPIRPRSSFLLKEMYLARWDPLKRTGSVPEGNGQHDDRLIAMLLALWQLRQYMPVGSYGEQVARRRVENQHRTKVGFQEMDIASGSEYNEVVEQWYLKLLNGR